jgi:hypothetical protein
MVSWLHVEAWILGLFSIKDALLAIFLKRFQNNITAVRLERLQFLLVTTFSGIDMIWLLYGHTFHYS